MAGTTLDRQLTPARTQRVRFTLATRDDDADIRRLLREHPMSGQITLTLEREPDYFADAGWPGTEKQTILARENSRLLCVGNCTLRERFVNGQPCRVGYLGGLRLDAQAAGRFDILRRGYDFFRELQTSHPAAYYFTSIAADNAQARKFLERGLPGMPTYEFIGEFVTALLPAQRRSSARIVPQPNPLDAHDLIAGLNHHNRDYQFAPSWSAREMSALHSLHLQPADFHTLRRNGNLIASAALWDQRTFKQTVIRGYAPWLAKARPIVNLAASMIRGPKLPPPGSTLAHAFLSHLAVPPDELKALVELVTHFRSQAAERELDFLTLGFAANDPRLTALRRKFRWREYRSRIYVVRWRGLGGSAQDLDARCLNPEVALL